MKRLSVFEGGMARPRMQHTSDDWKLYAAGIRHLISKNADWNQKVLADAAGTSPNTVSNVLKGRNRYLPTLQMLAKVFGKSYEEVKSIGESVLRGDLEKLSKRLGADQSAKPPAKEEQASMIEEVKSLRERVAVLEAYMKEVREALFHPRQGLFGEAEKPRRTAR